jgi:DUF971 family protein
MAEPESKYVPVEADVANHRVERKFRMKWNDGHEAKYPYAFLRGFCPCAACQGHFQATTFHLVPNANLARVDLIGSYALNLIWDDGHDTGIYTFKRLRDMCPCKACKPEGVEELRSLGLAQE